MAPGIFWLHGSWTHNGIQVWRQTAAIFIYKAVITISKGMTVELGPDNIRVNCINPVIGDTTLLEQFMGMPDTPENRSRFLAGIPLGRCI